MVACLGVGAPLSVAPAQPPTDRVLLYDGAPAPRGQTLSTTFSRPVPTVDPLGAPVGPDEPRLDQPELFLGAPRFTQVTTGDWSLSNMLAAGSALDGTPLWLYARRGNQYAVDLFATEPSGTNTTPGPGSVVHRWPLEDLWNGNVPHATAYLRSAAIYHGAVVAAAHITLDANPDDPDAWISGAGVGILVGNHDGFGMMDVGGVPGAGLRLVYTDAGIGIQRNTPRLRSWSVTGPYVRHRDGSPGKEVWFCVADYRPGAQSGGGAWVLLRAHRDTESDPWTFDPPCEVVRTERDGLPSGRITHAHTAGVAWDRASGRMTYISLAGDGDTKNAIFATPIDVPANYADSVATYAPAWWPGDPLPIAFAAEPHPAWLTVLDAPPATPTAWGPTNYCYHGAADDIPGAPATRIPAFQALGIAAGPTSNTLVIAADNVDAPGFARLDVEECPAECGAVLHMDQVVLGNSAYQALQGPGLVCFEVRNTTPEHGGPYLAACSMDNFKSGECERLLMGVADGDTIRWGLVDSNSFGPAYFVNGSIYRGWSQLYPPLGGLFRIDVAPALLARPERLGRGGVNVASAGVNSAMEVVGGADSDAHRVTGEELAALPPRPFLGPVVRLTMEPDADTLTLLTRATLRYQPIPFETGRLSTRVWVLAGDTDPPRANMVQLALGYRNSLSEDYIPFYSVRTISPTRWAPVDLFGTLPASPNNQQPVVRVTASSTWTGVPDRSCDLYVGFDSVIESTQPPGYPMPPDLFNQPGGMPAPSEARAISGFGGPGPGTLVVAGMIPHDGIDYGWHSRVGNSTHLPLITITDPTAIQRRFETAPYRKFVDAPPWITLEIVGGERLMLRAAGHGPPVVEYELQRIKLSRGDTFQIALRWSDGLVEVDSVWAGERADQPVAIGVPLVFPLETELRFGGPETDLAELSLPPLSIFGVGYWDERLDDAAIEEALHETAYLDPPAAIHPCGLAEPSGVLDWRDVAEFLRLFGAGDPRADLAAPAGALDARDVGALLDALSAPGCAPLHDPRPVGG